MQTLILSVNYSSLSEIPTLFWVASLAGILCAVFLGFFSGLYYARSEDERTLEKASKQFQKLFELTVLRLKQANQACSQLENFSQSNFNENDESLLQRLQNSISEKVSHCLKKEVPEEEPVEIEPEVAPISWETDILDPVTSIPTNEAIENNLNQMLEYSRLTGKSCSTFLCRIDKLDKLEQRVGKTTGDHFRQKISSILIRSLTDLDLVCQLDRSTFMVLMPDRSDEESAELVEQVIRAVRGYHFRTPETEQEVLVTASFGFTPCLAQDSHDTVLGRVRNAVSKSERRGRNQLHIHDGTKSIHSLVS